jgi:hypothetical protein
VVFVSENDGEEGKVDLVDEDLNWALAKRGSRYEIPGISKVRIRSGTKTFVADIGLIPRWPRNVCAHRLDPYAR